MMNGPKTCGQQQSYARGGISEKSNRGRKRKGRATFGDSEDEVPHPCDHPAVALAITRGLPGQMQKAKQNGDHATALAIEAALVRA
jgi:hypothetical protein